MFLQQQFCGSLRNRRHKKKQMTNIRETRVRVVGFRAEIGDAPGKKWLHPSTWPFFASSKITWQQERVAFSFEQPKGLN